MRAQITRRARLLGSAGLGAVAALAFAGVASAQDAPQDEEATQVEEVVITGIRSSIESSIAAKRENSSIVEVVTAEDIGKLPDMSIAESLARLPGLAAQRQDGRAQVITIRGLGPDFTTALLNGREQVTTGDNRGVEFDQYPSEALASVVVYKTPDGSLVGQGLAGTVDLRTIRPLQHGRRTIAANARYEWNDIGALNEGTTDNGNRFTLSYIDQFADDTIGLALGYAHMSSPYQAERYEAWGYADAGGGNVVIGGAKPFIMSSELERDGFFGTLEFRPNDRFHSTIDAFYSEFDNTQVVRGIELPLLWGGSPLSNATVEDGLVVAGTFSNVRGIGRGDITSRESKLTSVGWNTEIELNDRWMLETDLSYSKVDRTDQILETYWGTGRNGTGPTATVDFVMGDDGVPQFTSSLDYADPTTMLLTAPQGWGGDVVPGGQDGYLNKPTILDELQAARVTLHGELDARAFSGIEVGLYISNREKQMIADEWYLSIPGGGAVPVPAEFLMEPTSLSYAGIDGILSYDTQALLDSGFYDLVRNPYGDVQRKNWTVKEDVAIAHIKVDVDAMTGSIPVTGNLGMQVVYTDQYSTGFAATGSGPTLQYIPIDGGVDYIELLPSMNLAFELGDDLYLRTALARTMARPRMDQMQAGRGFGFNPTLNVPGATISNSPWSGGGGNPELRPWIADVADVSVERYFGRSGYVSLAAFYRYLETFVYDQQRPMDFTGFPVPPGHVPVINEGLYNSPQNGEGGTMWGIEFAASVPFDLFSPALEGFGAQFSISQNESQIERPGTGVRTAIPGLSETVGNLTLYYERYGFQSRISARHRSDFLGEMSGFANGRTLRQVAAETVLDAQVGYEFQSGPAEGLSILAQVNNLTDEPFFTYENGDERRVINHQRYGRTFMIGLNFRY
ncbi:TonB-dependent receptor [Brevundimonas sp.]|uniref:TonB-dependent receptor n=1 Tax=Brevundimonas sp. TaxID=1871086 RepID=UPI002D754E8F|nr:TonB-dependent receptor [Brevundimonas sp.]HYC73571.1 TonB-dependent receptor [Brevundimonas sp.]